jgi:CRISPR-associated endonuclease Cas1
MKQIVIFNEFGTDLRLDHGCILVINKQNDLKSEPKKIPLSQVEIVIINKSMVISTQLIQALAEQEILLVIEPFNGLPQVTMESIAYRRKSKLLVKQLSWINSKEALLTAKAYIDLKITQQINTLKKFNRRVLIDLNQSIAQLKQNQKLLKEIPIMQLDRSRILGYEGICAQIYWQSIRKCLAKKIVCEKRESKDALDLFNQCLNYAYGVIKKKIHLAILKASLSPLLGFLHDMNNDQNLIYDVLEILRPSIDYKIILFLKSQEWIDEYINEDDGSPSKSSNALKPQHCKLIANEMMLFFHQTINVYLKEDASKVLKQIQLKDFIEGQCYSLAQKILNQDVHEPASFQI